MILTATFVPDCDKRSQCPWFWPEITMYLHLSTHNFDFIVSPTNKQANFGCWPWGLFSASVMRYQVYVNLQKCGIADPETLGSVAHITTTTLQSFKIFIGGVPHAFEKWVSRKWPSAVCQCFSSCNMLNIELLVRTVQGWFYYAKSQFMFSHFYRYIWSQSFLFFFFFSRSLCPCPSVKMTEFSITCIWSAIKSSQILSYQTWWMVCQMVFVKMWAFGLFMQTISIWDFLKLLWPWPCRVHYFLKPSITYYHQAKFCTCRSISLWENVCVSPLECFWRVKNQYFEAFSRPQYAVFLKAPYTAIMLNLV